MKIELKQIHKRFGPVHANNDVTLTVAGGTIHGLLGENGAGKSTLMKVLSGFISADSGEIMLNGRSVTFNSPADAIQNGVGMLHQDPLDFPPMRLLDNFIAGRDGGLRQNRTAAEAEFRKLCQQFDFDLDPDAFVFDITVGERQQLEIVRLLWLGVQGLILDEPTTGISAPQKVKLFATLKQLAAQGKSIIFVSHKLEDVEELCSEATVLRQGAVTGRMPAPFETDGLIEMMFGQVFEVGERPSVPLGSPLLQISDLTISDERLDMAHVDLEIAAGEVIGIAGLEGSGQRLLMQACAGLLPTTHGRIAIDGRPLTNAGYTRYTDAGVAFMPANRMDEGLVPGLTIAEHMILAQRQVQKKAGLPTKSTIDFEIAQQQAETNIAEFNIKGRPDSTVESLSGGNQQRTLLALLPPKLRLLIMEHPTRGLDVESALYIWGKLLARREEGTAIMYSSADLDEILQYSDRIVICFGGQVTAVVPTATTSVTALGYLIAGRTVNEQPNE
ncbi:ABC transporter ATP-binding protein [Candidatus Leptofilum sp.]|uniref:ABC transporter ATP-binding protein n=1 Tax=Candidatus Leptofilum sp. TaxID=3241576 RepID=UPI003B5CFEDC